MPTQREIYESFAEQYERLIVCEDYRHNIFPALTDIVSLEALDVVELGAGTGRLTTMLAPLANTIRVFDSALKMLKVARRKLNESKLENWQLAVADHRNLPLGGDGADLVISGWSICYLVTWYKSTWKLELTKALSEMKRVLRGRGTIIILETLGTDFQTPQIMDSLADYFKFLDATGFQSKWIRTDYKFESLSEAEALTSFFFGDKMPQEIINETPVTLPECTGIWWLTV